MPEKKQYISHSNAFGRIFISEDVISSIVYHTLCETEGFAGLSARLNSEFGNALSSKYWRKGMNITITEKGNLLLEVNILVYYGVNVIELAKSVQDSITNAVGSTTGLYPKRVHVNVCGIVRK